MLFWKVWIYSWQHWHQGHQESAHHHQLLPGEPGPGGPHHPAVLGAPGGSLLPHPRWHVGLGQSRLLTHGLRPVPCHECLSPLPDCLHHREVHRHLSSHEGPGERLFGKDLWQPPRPSPLSLLFELKYGKYAKNCMLFLQSFIKSKG